METFGRCEVVFINNSKNYSIRPGADSFQNLAGSRAWKYL